VLEIFGEVWDAQPEITALTYWKVLHSERDGEYTAFEPNPASPKIG